MIRLGEVALFLAPFLLFLLWWRLGMRGRLVVWATVTGVLLVLSGLTWLALTTGLPRAGSYIPARLQNGQVVEGHGR